MSAYMMLSRELSEYTIDVRERMRLWGEVDALTGVENRNKYLQRAESEYAKASALGVVYMDVNNLKMTNDRYGHSAGDRLLRCAAQVVHAMLREGIHGYRLGGDEFALILPECTEDEMERLYRDCVACKDRLCAAQNALCCEIAIGWAWGIAEEGLDAILKRADSMMYADKQRQKCGG